MDDNSMAFIHRISGCLGRTTFPSAPSALQLPNDVQHEYLREASAEELQAIFVKNARAAGTKVYECSAAALNDTIFAAIANLVKPAELGPVPILLSDEPLWQKSETITALQQAHDRVQLWDMGQGREENIAFAEQAAVGIAVAKLALAETGTVMVFSEKGCGRSITLLPKTTIFVIDREKIRPRLTQAMEYIQDLCVMGLPSSINFISGASSTSDIELVRVQGVHGPVKIAYIVVGRN